MIGGDTRQSVSRRVCPRSPTAGEWRIACNWKGERAEECQHRGSSQFRGRRVPGPPVFRRIGAVGADVRRWKETGGRREGTHGRHGRQPKANPSSDPRSLCAASVPCSRRRLAPGEARYLRRSVESGVTLFTRTALETAQVEKETKRAGLPRTAASCPGSGMDVRCSRRLWTVLRSKATPSAVERSPRPKVRGIVIDAQANVFC